ncbi:MAG: UDP-N-acetylmuramate dehydrogenase [Spirochaetia bacterium]|nr:UDP-N-acetylmuramate dehydrogenase [Spirochaetia bacterium]
MDTLRKIFQKSNIDAQVLYDEPLARRTSFRIGGPADVFVLPRNTGALAAVMRAARDAGTPMAVLGGGANVLASDAGFRGVVVCTSLMDAVELVPSDAGSAILRAGAGAPVTALVRAALARGLAGIEFAAGLPGSAGGAAYMNARCYDREMADILASVDFLDANLESATMAPERGEWAYKRTPFMSGGRLEGSTIVGASFRLELGDASALAARAAELEADRRAKGHFDYPCAGSMFKNDRRFGRPTGKILDELGFRGRKIGGAMVSPKHANIFVNAGGARASDMLALVRAAQAAARERFGFELEPEVVLLGEF